uniref:Myb/SANT-like domain-containing protein n=1 Tax=Setaria viridis TaxID=4556 RepID=A0A4U6TN91_SETVI|nr:hypothetical protein SEVIR_8G246500v2 [Setaria viridis]
MYQFIKDIHSDSGLGRDENGWPTATLEWWETATKLLHVQKHPEWIKLMYGPPEYLPLLEHIFDGVVVDGSSSFVPGYTNADDQEPEEPEEPEEHEEPEQEMPEQELPPEYAHSPMSTSSRKRTSSTSTTASSTNKKTKSPMVKMTKDYISFSSKQQAERNQFIKEAVCNRQDKKQAQLSNTIKQAQKLVLECGVDETSTEYYAVSQICLNDSLREFFINIPTTEGRLTFLRRYCKQHNLD